LCWYIQYQLTCPLAHSCTSSSTVPTPLSSSVLAQGPARQEHSSQVLYNLLLGQQQIACPGTTPTRTSQSCPKQYIYALISRNNYTRSSGSNTVILPSIHQHQLSSELPLFSLPDCRSLPCCLLFGGSSTH
jgi:hypothetical protein